MSHIVTIEGMDIERIEYKGQAVITFKMIDKLHNRPEGTARKAFNNHQDRLIENEDYFRVPYEEWSQMPIFTSEISNKNTKVNDMSPQNLQENHGGYRGAIIFLTESGYLMIVKPFGDDLAWRIQHALVRNYFVVKEQREFFENFSYKDFQPLARIAEDDAALERMFRKRKRILIGMGLGENQAILKAIESVRTATEIDLIERMGFDPSETKDIPARSERLHKDTEPLRTQAPKTYKGWNLNKRGKNRKGEIIFNLAKKIGGKKRQKYLGVWNPEKADRIIDEMNRKYGVSESEPK